MVGRNFEEIISDNLLFLHLVSHADDLGRTKLQKLVYLIECKLGRKGIHTFNYNFFRWDYGPFTAEIFQDGEALVENDVLLDFSTKPSEKGFDILCQCEELFEDNNEIVSKINKLIKKYDDYSLHKLKDAVYNSKVELEGELIKVEDVPLGEDLNIKVDPQDAELNFNITEEWLETLDILFDNEFSESLNRSMEDAKKHRSYSFDEVLSDV